jgi:Phosphate-selective porin O and P
VSGALIGGLAASLAAQDSTGVRASLPVDVHGFLEVYYRASDPTTKDGYRLRKADLKFSGSVSPHLRWRVAFDASKLLTVNKTLSELGDSIALSDAAIDQRTRMLQDAALTLAVNHSTSIDIGQQIIPLSLEGTISTANVETIERTMFIIERSRAVGLGDIRDIGVSTNGLVADVFEYHAGLFNETGESQGTTDPNAQKAFVGRFAVHPPQLPGFQIGGSGGFQGGPTSTRRERAGTEVQFKDSWVTVRAETMTARDAELRRFGWYTLAAVRPTPPLQLVARYDAWDRDRAHEASVVDAFERQIVVGGSYLIDGTAARFVVNAVRQSFPNVGNAGNGTFLLFAFEAAW